MPVRDLPTGTVTFLFTDIEGSTQLARSLGAAWGPTLERHNAVLRAAIRDAGGTEVRTIGDAFFAAFATAPAAVRASVAIQRGIAEAFPGASLRVRIGIHTGEGVLGGDEYVGLDVHLAARMAESAHGGQVLLTDATRMLVEGSLPVGVALRDRGVHRLKDFEGPQRASDLVVEGLSSEFPPPQSLGGARTIPVPRTSFVGRERELAAVGDLIEACPLVTLVGPGGTGKTRLALRTAEISSDRLADGVWFVDLSVVREASLVPPAIAASLGLQEEATRSAAEVVEAFLAERSALLVLDNFEHVTGAAPVVDALLEAAPALRILVTSRVRLGLDGERLFEVPPLAAPDERAQVADLAGNESVALFVQRAAAVRTGFRLTDDNAPAIAEICARLEGLPLAIELAAVQVRVSSPAEIAERLAARVSVLGSGPRTAPERQRTLRSAIAWSHDLLDYAQRRALARLAVFQGGATTPAFEAVCDPEAELGIDAMTALSALVDHSLVRAVDSPDGRRFVMLETIREFGLEQLEALGEGALIRDRHAGFFAEFAERAEPHLLSVDRESRLEQLDREHANLRAAIRWTVEAGRAELGMRLVAALWRYWQTRSHIREGRFHCRQALALSHEQGTREHIRALRAEGGLAYWQADLPGARISYEKALALARAADDPTLLADALYDLSWIEGLDGRIDAADGLLHEAGELREAMGDRVGRAWVDVARAQVLRMSRTPEAGRLSQILPAVEAAAEIFAETGDAFGLENALATIAIAAFELGDIDRCEALLRANLARNPDTPGSAMMAFAGLASSSLKRGDAERALRLWGAYERMTEEIGASAPEALLPLGDTRAEAAAAMPAGAAAALREEGRRLTLDQATRYALGEEV